jgi:hypothetical protein
MTTYATMNPLGSYAVKDVYDNGQNLDYWANGPMDQYPDRFGVMRLSYKGIENQANTALVNTGFVDIGDYDANGPLTITRRNQVFTHGGQFYSASAALTLPYTTVNNWTTDAPKFVNRGDFVLRQDLAASGGAARIGALTPVGATTTVQALLDSLKKGTAYVRNVIDDFGAKGDGIVDDTTAVQAAFDWAATTGAYLRMPAGVYKTTATLKIKNSFRLIGDGFDTGYRRSMGAQTRYGSYFYFAHSGRGIEQSNSTTVTSNTNGMTMRDFATIRDQPTPTNSSFAPTGHTWDIYMAGYGACEIDNVCVLKATRGIYCEQRAVLNQIKGQAFGSFIQIDNNFDVVHITNCHHWPYWDESTFAMDYTRGNTIAYALYRADNCIMSDNFSYAHRYGLQLAEGVQGVPSRLKCTNLDLDGGAFGVVNTAPGSTSFFDNLTCTSWDGVAVGNAIFSSAVGASMEIDGFLASNIPEQAVYVEGNNNILNFSSRPHIEGWNKRNNSKPAIAVVSPAAVYAPLGVRCLRSNGNGAQVLTGTGIIQCPLGKSVAALVTSNANGLVVVTHGFHSDPNFILLQLYNSGAIALQVYDHNDTTFTVRLYNPSTGAAVANTQFAFAWSAEFVMPYNQGT